MAGVSVAMMLVAAVAALQSWLCVRQLRRLSRDGNASSAASLRLKRRLALALLQGLAAGLALAAWQADGTWWWAPAGALLALSYAPPLAEARRRLRRRGGRTGLAPDGLEMRLRGSLHRWGHAQVRVLVERAPAGSPQLNARAELSGASGSIVLLDKLAQHLTPPQVEAVMAHELGHLAYAHLQRRKGLLATLWLVALGLAAALVWSGSRGAGGWPGFAAVLLAAPSLRFLLQPLLMRCLQRWELEADGFAASLVAPAQLAATLARLSELNGPAPPSDRWFALFHDSHPLLQQRLARLQSL